jgi:hypothetical protein
MGLFLKQEEEIVVVLDITSGHISGVLMLKNSKDSPLILVSCKKEFAFVENVDAHRLRINMLSALSYTCEELIKNSWARPSRVFVSMSSPWSYGELRSVRIEREKEFIFRGSLASQYVSLEEARFEKERGNTNLIIDKKITAIHLNGYTVKKPHGQKARRADIDIFMSCAPHALIHDIEDAIHRTFKSKILFTSGMAADVVSVRDFLPLEKDFLLISPQEEVTEVSVLKSGTPSSTAVYPQGTRTVVRTIAAGLQTSLHEAQSLLRMHAASMLDEPTDKRFREQASVAANQWCSSLKDVLLEMLPTRHMPSRIVVLASNETSAWLGGYMRHMFFPEFTTSQREFDVIICTTTTLHHFFRAAAGVQVDSGVVTKSIFINRI